MVGRLKKKRFIIGLFVAIVIGAAFCLAFHFNLLYSMQLQSSDFLFKAAGLERGTAPEEKIVIVSIDDKSLEQLGRFSLWPRSHYAELIDAITEAKARVIVLDILFSEPAPGDEQLTASISNAGNVILPLIDTSTVNDSAAKTGSFLRPLPVFAARAVALGHANVFPDADGVVRRLPILSRNATNSEPSLALAAVTKYLRLPGLTEPPTGDGVLPFAGRLIPINANNEMLINYIGGQQEAGGIANFQTVSFVDVLQGEIAPASFADKIVVVGATATGLGDTFWTPMGRMMNGIEVHASAIHTILSGDFLKPAPSAVTIASILILALLCGLAMLRLRVAWATLATVLLCLAYFLIAFSFFDQGIVLNMLYPPLALLGTFVGVNLYNVVSEQSEKREITKTFGRYISPPVVDKILAAVAEDKLKLGGEEHEITVAFADVRGFTGISEKMPPEELVRVLNTYLSIVIQAVLKNDGIINKFGGDSIMAIWNVPTACERHALLATKAAIDAQRAIKQLEASETNLPKMDFGIGINTGKAVAGNMGSEDRLEYSVIGDAVNIAARLASATLGGKVWIGANTFEQVKDYVTAKPLEALTVKGKREPIKAYEIIDFQSEKV